MQGASKLTLAIDLDTDGTAELTAEVVSRGFGGRSSAWFNVQAIRDFADSLEAYPMDPDPCPNLSGGYWAKGQRGVLAEAHVTIQVYPVGETGQLGIHLRLATPSSSALREAERCMVETELLTDYNRLADFASRLRIAIEDGTQATLVGKAIR